MKVNVHLYIRKLSVKYFLKFPLCIFVTEESVSVGSLPHWTRWWQEEVLTLNRPNARHMNG